MLLPRIASVIRLARWLGFLTGLALIASFTASADVPLAAQERAAARAALDASGDPLPAGALARLGTLRWRHGGLVTFVAFLPDGKAVLTGGLDNTLRLWDRRTGEELRRFVLPADMNAGAGGLMGGNAVILLRMQGGGQPSPALSPDGKLLAAALPDNRIQLWDVATGREILKLNGTKKSIAGFAFAPDGKRLAVRGADQAIYVLDTATGEELHRINRDKQPQGALRVAVRGQRPGDTGRLAFAPDGKTLAAAETGVDANNQSTAFIRIVEIETGKTTRRIDLKSPSGAITLAYAPDGKTLAYADVNTLHLCNAETGDETHEIKTPPGLVALTFAPDSKTLAGRGTDQLVRLWDTATGGELHRIGDGGQQMVFANPGLRRLTGADVRSLAFAPDGKTVAAADGNTVRFWSTATGAEQPPVAGHRGPVSAVSISANGKTLISRGGDGMIRVWDLTDGRQISAFREPGGTTSIAVSADGKTLACAGNGANIHIVHIATGKPTLALKGHANGTAIVAFAPHGNTLASAGAVDHTIRLHDAINGTMLRQIVLQGEAPPPNGVVLLGAASPQMHLAFSADGRTLVGQFLKGAGPMVINANGAITGGGTNGTVLRQWDVATGKEIRTFTLPPRHGVGSVAVSPDGRAVATDNADGTLSLWETASGKQRMQLGEPRKEPVAGRTAPPANFVAIAGPVRVGASDSTLSFSPDGSLLVSKGPDNSVRIWDVAAGKQIGTFKGHIGAISAVAFTLDGKRLATGSHDTTILLWNTAGLKREPVPSAPEPHAQEVAERWADLAGDDAAKAYQSIRRLAVNPQAAVPFLREQLKPAVPADPKKLAKLVADLDSEDFTDRDNANQELAKLGELALPALNKIMEKPNSLESRRRAEALLAKLSGGALTPDELRVVRAVEVLETAATPEARQALEALARGAPGVLPTREAHAALERLRSGKR